MAKVEGSNPFIRFTRTGAVTRVLDGFLGAGAVRLSRVLALAIAACCVGVASAGGVGVIHTIHVGKEPRGVSSDGTHVWVANGGEETVSEIKASSGTVIRTIHVGEPWGVSSDGTHVWVTTPEDATAHERGDTVSEIDASSGVVIRTIHVGKEPLGVSSDGTDVWVANAHDRTVSEIKASSGTVIRTIHVGGRGGYPLGVSSDGTHVWVTDENDTVSEIKASNGTVVRTIQDGSGPWGVSSDGTHAWVGNYGGGPGDTVSEIPTSYTSGRAATAGRSSPPFGEPSRHLNSPGPARRTARARRP
jgi:YVTN family beta-propeller protein